MQTKELEEYRQFTKPAELHKALNTLKGIVAGITTDSRVGKAENHELMHWCLMHIHLRNRHPFSELIPMIEAAYEDEVITDEESRDIIWLCNNFLSDSNYYDLITSSIQFLSGLLHGIMADGVLSDEEVRSLSFWVQSNDFLRGCYPFDEIDSLLTACLADGVVSDDERNMLMAFFSNFIDLKISYNLSEPQLATMREQYSLDGICATCPEISFLEKRFVFTGESSKYTRNEIFDRIAAIGGICTTSVTKKTNYVIVGNKGNPCWAYSCYGRKIEEAVNLRKSGARVIIVHESDLWDAYEDFK